MSIESRLILTSYFAPGATPSSADFTNLIDSCLNLNDDGVAVYTDPGTGDKKIGIGSGEPISRLGIKAFGATEGVLDFYNSATPPVRKWTIDLKPGDPANEGLGIEQPTAMGDVNRFFIQSSTGFIGIGTLDPQRKLHIQDTASTDIVGLKTQNMSTGANLGWSLGHLQDADERDGAFSLIEKTSLDSLERMVIRAGGNVGINEPVPDVKLHVSRALADPFSALDLLEGTGIMVLGPMTDNVVFDYEGLQARHGEFVGDVLNITAATLNLQRLGGDILIHGDSTFSDSVKGIINGKAWLGLGTVTPVERLDINGAIKIGTTTNPSPSDGTIRFDGTDFQGYKGGTWVSLTGGSSSGPWTIGAGNGIYYDTGSKPRVAIGDNKNINTLDVTQQEVLTDGSIAINVINMSTTTSVGPDDDRVGIEIINTGAWGGDLTTKDIGLYVREVSGQSDINYNIAAVLNGNVVVGDTATGQSLVGTGGQRVLALQPGATVPTAVPDLPAVQIYAGANAFGNSALSILTTDNILLSLYQESPLTTADTSVVGDAYTIDVANVINNMRDRINELERKLQSIGFLA